MIDFRSLYRFAEEHTAAYIAVLFGFFFLLIAAQSIFSGIAVLAITIGAGFFILTLIRPFWTLVCLSLFYGNDLIEDGNFFQHRLMFLFFFF